LNAMSTRHEICAIERAASQAEPEGLAMPTLILGTLLLLICP
jgi:hypothetical protein